MEPDIDAFAVAINAWIRAVAGELLADSPQHVAHTVRNLDRAEDTGRGRCISYVQVVLPETSTQRSTLVIHGPQPGCVDIDDVAVTVEYGRHDRHRVEHRAREPFVGPGAGNRERVVQPEGGCTGHGCDLLD